MKTILIRMRLETITFLIFMALVPFLGSCAFHGAVPYSRGNSFLEQGHYDAAIAEFSKALEINPQSALAYYHRGLAYAHKGAHEMAVPDYTRALAVDTGVLEARSLLYLAYYHRGVSYHKLGKLDPAIVDFTKAIEINSDVADAYVSRGKVFLDRRQNKQAMVDFNKALEIKPALAGEINPWLARAKTR